MIVAATILAALGTAMAHTNAAANDERQVSVPEGTRTSKRGFVCRLLRFFSPRAALRSRDSPFSLLCAFGG
jgi:hypothetical protein